MSMLASVSDGSAPWVGLGPMDKRAIGQPDAVALGLDQFSDAALDGDKTRTL